MNIRDIAKQAGVSVATVSYVLNQSRPVSAELTRRVKETIELLGYSPNYNARSLRSKFTHTIGLVVPDNANPFFAEFAKGVEDAGFDAGYAVILCNSNMRPERELAYLKVLQSRRVDGIILCPTAEDVQKQIKALLGHEIPVSLFYRDPGDLNADRFLINNFEASYQAVHHLIEIGHRCIACIQPASMITSSAQRVEGYKQALKDSGLPLQEELMPRGDNLIGGGHTATQTLLASGMPFSAIFACNDAMAIGAIRALHEAGRLIPKDISVIGFDDITLALYSEPALTTVANPKEEAGRLGVQYLVERIEGKYKGGPRKILLETHLVVRASSASYNSSKE